MPQVLGQARTGLALDAFVRDAAGLVWNGSAYVAWADADYASYRVAADEDGASGDYVGTLPAGAASWVLRVRAGTLAGSRVVWTEKVGADTAGTTTTMLAAAGAAVTLAGDAGVWGTAGPLDNGCVFRLASARTGGAGAVLAAGVLDDPGPAGVTVCFAWTPAEDYPHATEDRRIASKLRYDGTRYDGFALYVVGGTGQDAGRLGLSVYDGYGGAGVGSTVTTRGPGNNGARRVWARGVTYRFVVALGPAGALVTVDGDAEVNYPFYGTWRAGNTGPLTLGAYNLDGLSLYTAGDFADARAYAWQFGREQALAYCQGREPARYERRDDMAAKVRRAARVALLGPGSVAWAPRGVDEGTLLWDAGNNKWRLWASGWDSPGDVYAAGLGYWETTGNDFATLHEVGSNPILGQGVGGVAGVQGHTVHRKPDGTFVHLFSTATGGGAVVKRAVSTDGRTLTGVTTVLSPADVDTTVSGLHNPTLFDEDGDGVPERLLVEATTDSPEGDGGTTYLTWAGRTADWGLTFTMDAGGYLPGPRLGTGMVGGPFARRDGDGLVHAFFHQSRSETLPTRIYHAVGTSVRTLANDGAGPVLDILEPQHPWDQEADVCLADGPGGLLYVLGESARNDGVFESELWVRPLAVTFAQFVGWTGARDADAVRAAAQATLALKPTTAGRTLDVAATGEAGVDLANIKQATAPTTLANIVVPRVTLTDTATAVTEEVAVTSDQLDRIEQQANLITTGQLNHLGAVVGTSVTLHQGDSYGTASGEQLPFAKPSGASWPDLADGWTVTFVAEWDPSDPDQTPEDETLIVGLSKACSVTSSNAFRLDLDAADTAMLAPGVGAWAWQAIGTKNTLKKTLREGEMSVVPRVAVG